MVGFDTPIMGTAALMAEPSSRAETATVRVSLPFMLVIVHTTNVGSSIILLLPMFFVCTIIVWLERREDGRQKRLSTSERNALICE